MGYLFLAAALMVGLTKGYCGKKTSGLVRSYPDTMLLNAVRMLMCIVIGFFFVFIPNGSASPLNIAWKPFLISSLSGLATSIFVVSWIIAVRRGAYMMLEVFLTLGVIVPMLLCYYLYGEPIKTTQWFGLGLLAIATYIMCSYNNTIKAKITLPSFILLVISGLGNGLTQFSQKWFLHECPDIGISVFNFYTYVSSAVVLVACYLTASAKEPLPEGETSRIGSAQTLLKRIFFYVLTMSVCLFLHSFFSTFAGKYLPAARLYPLSQGASLMLSTMMSAICFKERVTAKSVTGLIIAFAALLIINLL